MFDLYWQSIQKSIVDRVGQLGVILLVMDAGNNNSVVNTSSDKKRKRLSRLSAFYFARERSMKQLIIILGICFLVMVSLACGQERYHSDKLKFSFVLPEGWQQAPDEKASKYQGSLSFLDVRPDIIEMELFSVNFADAPQTPYIYLESFMDTSKSEAEKEEHYLSHKRMEEEYTRYLLKNPQRRKEMEQRYARYLPQYRQRRIDRLKEGKMGVPKSWKGAELKGKDFYYDKYKHAAFEIIELYHERVGKILYVDVRILGSRRYVKLKCYWDGEDPDEFRNLLNNLVYSFSFDEGYGFREGLGLVEGVMDKVPPINYLRLGIIIGFGIALFLLYRFAKH